MNLIVTAGRNGALLNWGAGARRAAIGPGGIALKGGEGDGITPRGIFPVREVFLSRRPHTGAAHAFAFARPSR
jgi:L,D-peptidoglycan transpeptidase YkuD (ErfK/YbiS/YcfS/YnhG family)